MYPGDNEPTFEPESSAPARWRLVAALVVFLIITTGGAYLLSRLSPAAAPHVPQPTASEQSDKLFYEGIGVAPARQDIRRPASQASYTLELRLTEKRDDAEELIDTLNAQGIAAYFTPLSRSGHIVYRVRHGIFESKEHAQRAQLALKSKHKLETKVVQLQ